MSEFTYCRASCIVVSSYDVPSSLPPLTYQRVSRRLDAGFRNFHTKSAYLSDIMLEHSDRIKGKQPRSETERDSTDYLRLISHRIVHAYSNPAVMPCMPVARIERSAAKAHQDQRSQRQRFAVAVVVNVQTFTAATSFPLKPWPPRREAIVKIDTG